jgi:hypothetical protein
MDYKQKYLKYKTKYLDLYKMQRGGWCITKKCKIKTILKKAGFSDENVDEYGKIIIEDKINDDIINHSSQM